jgi:hypothetical protein
MPANPYTLSIPRPCLTAIALAFLATAAFAQPKLNAPYTRYGLGYLQPQHFIAQAGMGGQSIAFHDFAHLNPINPASYAFLNTATFETGLNGGQSFFRSDNDRLASASGNMSYLALGFTLRNPINQVLEKETYDWQFGAGLSLRPYSTIGYNIQANDTLPDLGIVASDYRGDGGTYRLAWSTAARYKNTAFGVNLGWMFGFSNLENATRFVDTMPTFNNYFSTAYRLNGFFIDAGLQHDFILEKAENQGAPPRKYLTLGMTAKSRSSMDISADRFWLRARRRLPNGNYITPDTLLNETGIDRKLILPGAFGVGLMLVKTNSYRLGAQYQYENWNAFRNELTDERLQTTHGLSLGGEYIPDDAAYNNYLRRVRLRAGAWYRQDPRVVNGSQLIDIGGSLGFGFPIILPRLQTSYLNAAFEFGSIGQNAPIRELYYRINLGFCLNDNSWFYKRRFE